MPILSPNDYIKKSRNNQTLILKINISEIIIRNSSTFENPEYKTLLKIPVEKLTRDQLEKQIRFAIKAINTTYYNYLAINKLKNYSYIQKLVNQARKMGMPMLGGRPFIYWDKVPREEQQAALLFANREKEIQQKKDENANDKLMQKMKEAQEIKKNYKDMEEQFKRLLKNLANCEKYRWNDSFDVIKK